MLSVKDVDQEFEIKSGCLRKKSEDFNREKNKNLFKLSISNMPERFDEPIIKHKGTTFHTKRAVQRISI